MDKKRGLQIMALSSILLSGEPREPIEEKEVMSPVITAIDQLVELKKRLQQPVPKDKNARFRKKYYYIKGNNKDYPALEHAGEASSDPLPAEVIEKALPRLIKFGLQPNELAVVVQPSSQRMFVIKNGQKVTSFRISSSRYGIGTGKDSDQTPPGMHQVAYKRGYNLKLGQQIPKKTEGMMTRFLALEGLEPGVNRGGDIDTLYRGIGFHGTPEEDKLGLPNSHGCFRMKNRAILAFFNTVPEGTLVEVMRDDQTRYRSHPPKPVVHTKVKKHRRG